MTKVAPVRIGIIGLGRIGSRAITAAEKVGLDIVSALDVAERPIALGEHPRLEAVFTRDPEIFWATPFDALVIMATADAHVPLLLTALQRGARRILVEKAFATGVDEAERAIDAANKAGARIVVNHGRRYCPNYAHLTEMAERRTLGDLRAISVSMGAGGMGCMGIHHIETFNRFLGGMPHRVFALPTGPTPPNARGQRFDDPGAVAVLEYPSGRRGLIEVADDTGIPPRLEFRFTFGSVAIEDELSEWKVSARNVEDHSLPLTRYGTVNTKRTFPNFRPFGLMDMLDAALHDLIDDRPVIAAMEPAARAVEVFAGLRHSLKINGPVSLPLAADARQAIYAIP